MKKVIVIILIALALITGIILGNYWQDFFPQPRPFSPLPPKVSKEIAKTSEAFAEIVKADSPAVVNISTTKTIRQAPLPFLGDPFFRDFFGEPFDFGHPRKYKEQSLGSGVIVSPDGYIITNYHVIKEADEIKVTLYDKRDFKGIVVGSDPKTDIAVIRINTRNLPTIPWGDSDKLQVGEFVLAIGNPFGLSHTVTMGIVSAVGRANVGIADYEDFIQTDAAINPGNSGGPLVNIRGELIGINTAIFSKSGGYQGIGFAVPSNMARTVMEELIKKGKVIRGWLGVSIQEVTPELAREFGTKTLKGALVADVSKGSPADRAGIRRGDIIIEFDGKEIEDVGSLRNMAARATVGNTVRVKLIRNRNIMTVNVTIAELPKEISEATPSQGMSGGEQENALAGLTVMDLTKDIAKQLNLPKTERGVVVVRVEPDSAGADAGLKKGDVIEEINRKRIGGMADFDKAAQGIHEGDTVLIFINRAGKKFYITLKAS